LHFTTDAILTNWRRFSMFKKQFSFVPITVIRLILFTYNTGTAKTYYVGPDGDDNTPTPENSSKILFAQ